MADDREVHDPQAGHAGGVFAALKRLLTGGEEPTPRQRRRRGFVSGAQRVLLPTRGTAASEVAAQLLARIYEASDVEVTRLLVRDATERAVSRGEPVGRRLASIERHLPDLRTVERDAGADGIAGVVLAEARRGYDLLVLPTIELREMRGRPPVADFVDDIVEEAPCPLMLVVVPEAQDDGPVELSLQRILLPVGGRPEDRGSAEVAFCLGRERETTVDVVHVVSEPEERAMLQRRFREREEARSGREREEARSGRERDEARSGREREEARKRQEAPRGEAAMHRPSAERIFRQIKRGPLAREGAAGSASEGAAGSASEPVPARDRSRQRRTARTVAEGHLPDLDTNTLREMAQRARSMDAHIRTEVLVADEPEDELVALAREGVDLIVMACHRRPVRHRAFSGPGIDRILRASPCPVVVTLDPL